MRSKSPSSDREAGNAEMMSSQVELGQRAIQAVPAEKRPAHVSKVIHYQGARSPDTEKLFFVADETGSTFRYIQFPNLGPNLGVYGVESTFAKNPADIDLDIKQLANAYWAAIQREQPSGP